VLLAVAAAGAVLASDTLSGCAAPAPEGAAAPQGTVKGTVSGPGVTDFTGCVVILSGSAGTKPSALMTPVNPNGSYVITAVPPGEWIATCVPPGGTPLSAMTYNLRPGYSAGNMIKVGNSKTAEVDFSLQPAGALQVVVENRASAPVSGVYVWNYESSSRTAAGMPVATDSNGSAILTNVPLTSKVFVVDPATQVATWWKGATSWNAATVVTLPSQGAGITITAALTEG
jgi:hypothetical protein